LPIPRSIEMQLSVLHSSASWYLLCAPITNWRTDLSVFTPMLALNHKPFFVLLVTFLVGSALALTENPNSTLTFPFDRVKIKHKFILKLRARRHWINISEIVLGKVKTLEHTVDIMGSKNLD
jgi:hypothetical protein